MWYNLVSADVILNNDIKQAYMYINNKVFNGQQIMGFI